MAHPKLCPCPNCAGGGSKIGLLLWLAVAAVAAYGVWVVGDFLAQFGRGWFIVIGGLAFGLAASTIIVGIAGSVVSGRAAEHVRVYRGPEEQPAPAEVTEAPSEADGYMPEEVAHPHLRLVRKEDVA
jgi:hypothetical protein